MHEPSSYHSTGGNNGGYTIADDSDGSNSKNENQEEDRYGTERDGDQKQDEDQYGRDWDRNDGEIDQLSRVDNNKDDYTKDHEHEENRYSLQTADDKQVASHGSYDGDHNQSFDHDDHHSSRSVEEKGDDYSIQERDHIERQSLGPSSLGGDEIYTALSLGDVETQSQQRILAFAAKRCANAVQKNPQDYDALYNWALVLQETADNINGDTVGNGKDQLLEEACEKYKAATDICPTLHEAFYNWAIAISDRAKVRGRTKEAEDLWKQACQRYERAVHFNRNSPQAFNNWGLALQELSGIVSIKNKRSIVKTAIKKFRAAITLQFDFHRAIYNLGTVLYGLAEDTIRSGSKEGNSEELTAAELYSQSAIYVAAAHALKPEYPVYKSALRLVRSKLPLAYLKTGYLVVPPEGDILAPHNDWKRSWFVLDHEAIYQVDRTGTGFSQSSPMKAEGIPTNHSSRGTTSYTFRIDIADICGLNRSADLSLPPGAAFEIDTVTGPKYLIANSWEEVDCWVDAVRLVFTIYSRGQSEVLGGIIAG